LAIAFLTCTTHVPASKPNGNSIGIITIGVKKRILI
jgi:hypothetical protein